MKVKKISQQLSKVILILSLISGNMSLHANEIMPTLANKEQISYYFHGESLQKAIIQFATANGLQVTFSHDVQDKLGKRVNGHYAVVSNEEFMNDIANQFGISWFIYAGTLYLGSTKLTSRSFDIAADSLPMLRSSLSQDNLLDKRFGYTDLPSENRVVVSGPQAYVDLIASKIQALNVNPMPQQFAVYRLKYANAGDLQVNFNNQQLLIPGVATILQRMLSGNTPGVKNQLSDQVNEPIKNQLNSPLAAKNANDNLALDKASSNSDKASNSGAALAAPLIQADSRLNTIVIRDKASNLLVYKNLIDLLDVPAPLIQVEVLIIHLDQDELEQAGVNWWASYKGGSVGYGTADMLANTPTNSLAMSYGQVNPGQLLVTNMGSFVTSLQALEKSHIAQTVGRPSLATTDNLPAIINVNETLYLNGNGGSNASNNNANDFMQAQITQALQITPHIIFDEQNNKQIKLSIVLQDGTVSDPTNSVFPDTLQSTITSQAVVNEGQSILLAGYTRNVTQNITSKIPFLGDIPLLGWFFKNTNRVQKKKATLYLVTPKVIWLNNLYKLKDYVTVDGNKFDIKNTYQLMPQAESSPTKRPETAATSQAIPLPSDTLPSETLSSETLSSETLSSEPLPSGNLSNESTNHLKQN